MKKPITVETRNILAGLLLGLLSALRVVAADLNVPAQYTTIQAAVNAAASGDTIHIAPGVYAAQTTIIHKNLTLLGAPGAVLRATPGMPPTLSSYCSAALLGVELSDVVIQGLTLEGEHLDDAYTCSLFGILFDRSSGRLEDCTIGGFRGTNGQGIINVLNGGGFAAANYTNGQGLPLNVEVRRCNFADNASSIFLRGSDAIPSARLLTFTIEDNLISGVGPALFNQCGILISYGASGAVTRNRISGHRNAQGGENYSWGIWAIDWLVPLGSHSTPLDLLPVHYEGNTFVSNQLHLASTLAHGSQFVNNTFQGSEPNNSRLAGLALSGNTNQVIGNRFSDMATGITLVGNDPSFGTNFGIATNPMLISNRFCNVPMPIVIQPLVTGTTNRSTLVCPFPPPVLAISPAVLLSWPAVETGCQVECATNAAGPWIPLGIAPTVAGSEFTVTVRATDAAKFFRLQRP